MKLAVEDVASSVKRLRAIHCNLFRVVSDCTDSLVVSESSFLEHRFRISEGLLGQWIVPPQGVFVSV